MAGAWLRAWARCSVAVAVAAMACAGAFAQSSIHVTGAFSGPAGGSNIVAAFSCSGAPTCTGVYVGTIRDSSCVNPIVVSGAFTMALSSDLSAPGAIQGSITLANSGYQDDRSPDGTCSVRPNTSHDNTATFTGNWDGIAAGITVTVVAGDGTTSQLTGGFVKDSGTVAFATVNGSAGGSIGGGGDFHASFSCVGSPICSGTYSGTMRDRGCSNTFTIGGAITFSGFDLSPGGTIAGTAILQNGDLHDSVNPDGTCSMSRAPTDASVAYTGTFNGTTGTLTFTDTDRDTGQLISIPGTFTVSGIGSTPPPASPPPFQLTVSSDINPTTASASGQIVPPAADVGKTVSVYVFALAPRSLVKSARLAAKDDTNACVLAQLDPATGQLHAASATNLGAFTTGVLSAQGQSVTILNNASTPAVAGATFFVGYGPDAGTMISTGVNQSAVTIPGSQQCPTVFPALPGTLSGLWWKDATESGWGMTLTQRGHDVFAAWFTYDGSGKSKWYVSTCDTVANSVSSGRCTGDVTEVTGAPFFGATFNPGAVHAAKAGTLQLDFADADHASMSFSVGGVTRTVPVQRQLARAGLSTDFTDLWWNPQESGWGLSISQQSSAMFLTWFVYDGAGKPVWYVSTCTASATGNGCAGDLVQVSGPPFGPTFDPQQVHTTVVGTVAITFTDPNHGTLNYTVNGSSGTKQVTRQIFQ